MAFWLDFSQTTADRRAHRPGSSPFEECNKYASLSGYIQALWEIIGPALWRDGGRGRQSRLSGRRRGSPAAMRGNCDEIDMLLLGNAQVTI
jgi:hypothetical protein